MQFSPNACCTHQPKTEKENSGGFGNIIDGAWVIFDNIPCDVVKITLIVPPCTTPV